jgi:hypothetical protein
VAGARLLDVAGARLLDVPMRAAPTREEAEAFVAELNALCEKHDVTLVPHESGNAIEILRFPEWEKFPDLESAGGGEWLIP